MKEFVCNTQSARLASFKGASGIRYTSLIGEAFKVRNEQDIDYFKNKKQFDMVGKFEKSPQVKKEDAGDDFYKFLSGLKGVTKKTAKLLVDSFELKENLENHLVEGGELPEELSKRQAGIIRAALSSDEEVKE